MPNSTGRSGGTRFETPSQGSQTDYGQWQDPRTSTQAYQQRGGQQQGARQQQGAYQQYGAYQQGGYPQPAGYQATGYARAGGYEAPKPMSAMAITGLVLGIIAILTSLIPIVNNISFFLALLGLVFAVVGLVGTLRGKRRGKGMAIASIVLNVLAIVFVLYSQSVYSAAVDQALNGPGVASTATVGQAAGTAGGGQASGDAQGAAQAQGGAAAPAATEDLAVGTAVTLDNGLTVSVDSVQRGLPKYDGATMTGIRVTYTNGGTDEATFNMLDWEGQDAQGVQSMASFVTPTDGGETTLGSGKLIPGGTVSGMIYFDGDAIKAIYSYSIFSGNKVTWNLA